MKLSVIIPVYRVERTLERCVRSVLSQCYTDCEIILVDDGSPDSCGDICDRFAAEESVIKVIHKVNGGLSDARNSGLLAASGEYVTFVDSDDFIAEGTYCNLMQIISTHPEYDILEYPVYVYYGAKDKERELVFNEKEYVDSVEYWLAGKAYEHSYAWNKIYRRELFENVRFPVGKIFEDIHILPLLLAKAKIVATTNVGLYYYCWNPNGITALADGKALGSLLDAHLNVLCELSLSHKNFDDFISYYMHVLNIQCDVCRLTGKDATVPTLRLSFIRSLVALLKKSEGKAAVKFMVYSLFGIKGLCAFNNRLLHR